MEETYKVGKVTFFGLLLAESVKLVDNQQIVSLYENEDKTEYTIIEWELSDNSFDNKLCQDIYDTSDKAWRIWTSRVFGISF